MELLDFLRARLDEDEHLARECEAEVGPERAGDRFTDDSGDADRDSFPSYPWGSGGAELAYMAGPGHPARVLREVEAKRALLEAADDELRSSPWSGAVGKELAETALRLLALPYADHPDYDEAWKP